MVHNFQGGHFVPDPPFCKICNNAPLCVNLCANCMYYIVHKQENLTQTTIHLGMHDHLVVKGHSRETFDQFKSLVEEKVSYTLGATMSAIALVASITFFS